MAWAIINIYTSKCAQMDPQQLLKTSKVYSRSKKCDIEETLGGRVGTTLPLGRPKVKGFRLGLLLSSQSSTASGNKFSPCSFKRILCNVKGYFIESVASMGVFKGRTDLNPLNR